MNGRKFTGVAVLCAAVVLWVGSAFAETARRQNQIDAAWRREGAKWKLPPLAATDKTYPVPILSAATPDESDLPGCFFRLDMKLAAIPTNEFRVALSASNPICMQPMPRDSIWVAAFAASRLTGKSLSGRRVEVHLPYAMLGTSAGLALALGIAEALEGQTLPEDFAVTGDILPNGLVGPVQGMPSKISAAAKAGVRRVAIPTKPRTETVNGKEVDPVEWGRDLGVEVVRVRTLAEARAWMVRRPFKEPATDECSALALPSAVAVELTRQTTNLLACLALSGTTNSVEEIRSELAAGRLFSARQLAMLLLAQRRAEQKVPPPASASRTAESRTGEWVSCELFGLEEKLRQEAKQGAPEDRLSEGLAFIGWLKALQTEQAAALIAACGAEEPAADGLSALSGLSYALADLFEQTTVASVANVRGRSVDQMYQTLYSVDPAMLIWKLSLMRLHHGVLLPTRAQLAWAAACGSAEIARFGGSLRITEDRQTEELTISYGCAVYLGEYVDESRKAALAAIAAERARGRFPALAIDAFERGERSRLCGKDELQSRLTAFEAYLRSYLLCAPKLAGKHPSK